MQHQGALSDEPHGIRPGERDYRRLVAAMFLAGVATFAQMYATQGVLPEITEELGTSAAVATLSASVTTLGVAVGVLPWSFIADRLGSRRALLVAMLAAIAPGFAGPLLPGVESLIAARLLEGLFLAGVPAVAMTFVLGTVRKPHHVGAAATYIAGTTVGGLAGRVISAPVAEHFGWRAGVLAVMVVCLIATVGYVMLLPRTARPLATAASGGLAALGRHLRDPRQLALYGTTFLLMGAFVSLYNFLGFRLGEAPHSLSPTAIGLVFLIYLAGTWSASRVGGLIGRFGRLRVVLGAAAVMAAGAALTIAEALPFILAGLLLATAGFFAVHAVCSAWAPELAEQGRNQSSSLYTLAYYSGSSLLGWATGFLFLAWGWTVLALAVIGLIVLGAGLVLVLARTATAPR